MVRPAETAGTSPLSRRRVPLILIAEDNEDVRAFMEESVLRPAGFEVRAVGDGLSALTLARELQPDVVISDHQMPNLSGLELIRRLRQDLPFLPVILMTAEGSEALAVEALRLGAADYLSKPFEAEALLAAVGRAREQSRRWQELESARRQAQRNAQALERRVRELEALAQIGRAVTAKLSLDEVLTTVVDAAVSLTDAEEGSLLLLDERSGELYMRASRNFEEDFARTFRLPVKDSLAGQVVATGKPVVLDENAPQKIKTAYLVTSLIYVPLQLGGRTIGVLGVDNRTPGRAFTVQNLTVLSAMADYAAIAIENARLYEESEAERQKMATVLSGTETGVILVDPEGQVEMVNRAARQALGLGEEALGQPVDEVFQDPALVAFVRASGGSRREEIEVSDGRFFHVQRAVLEGVGQVIVLHDITHFKELDRIKSEFVTTVSHDLRSPLTAILGYVELIERAGPLNQQQQEFVRRVQMSVEQITRLISDLLDLGRIEAGLDATKEKTPIAVLARYALEGLRGSAETKGLNLEVDLPEDLPMILGSPVRLRQMIGNLLENAIKYTPSGGTVRLEARHEADQIILRVSDTGPGIPAADQPYLFDKFYRGTNVRDDQPGTGLGLSIVKSIVDQHGGRIWVDSRLGEGTTFTVVLPAEPER